MGHGRARLRTQLLLALKRYDSLHYDASQKRGCAGAVTADGCAQVYFRGFNIVQAAKQELLQQHNLGAATELVMTGCSAGALAAIIHADRWAAALSHNARVTVLAESAWFLTSVLQGQAQKVLSLMNSAAGS